VIFIGMHLLTVYNTITSKVHKIETYNFTVRTCLVCIVVSCLVCIVVSCLVCIVVVVLCVLLLVVLCVLL